MINGLEGIPGSGKSYEAAVYHVLPSLAKGRKVITNLPLLREVLTAINPEYDDLLELRTRSAPILGTWDAARVDDKGNGSAYELFTPDGSVGQLADVNLGVFTGVWDFYSAWKHPTTGQGPIFLIDECHVCLPTIGTDPRVIEWFKLHRHFNADVLLCTQNFRDMNQPIARLIAMLVKVRKADVLGDAGSYIRKVHAGYRGAVISTEIRKYKAEYFRLYKSHSQGNSVSESAASDVKPFLVKFKKYARVFYVFTFAFCLYAAYKFSTKPIFNSTPAAATSQGGSVAGSPLASASAPVGPVAASPAAAAGGNNGARPMVAMLASDVPEPMASKEIHVTGMIQLGKRKLYTFAYSSGGLRVGQVTSDDLLAMGYTFEPLTHCAGTLRYRGMAKAVICDAPVSNDGKQSEPVVLAMPAGSNVAAARSDYPRPQ